MKSKAIYTLFEYNQNMHTKLWIYITKLTPEQFVQEVDYSIGSVRNHMVHGMSAYRRWLARLEGNSLPEKFNYSDYPTLEATQEKWELVEDNFLDYVRSQSDAQLQNVMYYEVTHQDDPLKLAAKSNIMWQILIHLINHATDHRAQVLSLLGQFNAPTFEQDLIFYFWDQAK